MELLPLLYLSMMNFLLFLEKDINRLGKKVGRTDQIKERVKRGRDVETVFIKIHIEC